MKRLLLPLCILMAVLILVISMTTVSFSWFEPDVKEGMGLEVSETTVIRSEDCTITENLKGTLDYSLVSYGNNAESTKVTVNEGTTVYYKTVIKNSSTEFDTNVSLFLNGFDVSEGGSASIGVAYPTNSFRTFKADQTDIHIVRNAYVPKFVASDAYPGELSVEWFVKCESGSVTFNPSQVYLMYS